MNAAFQNEPKGKIISDDSKINLSNSSNISNTANTYASVGNTNSLPSGSCK